jgi:cysteine-rich repeat protein
MKWLLLLALAVGCRDRTPSPGELALSPDRGRDDQETPVVITGRFVAAAFEIDRHDVKKVRPLSLRLGDRALEATLAKEGSLRAVVPPGIAAGPQSLEAVDPYGQTSRIDDAFCVLGPEAQVASFDVTTATVAVAGAPFALSLIARDADQNVVERFEGFARVTTSSVGPFVRGEWTGTLTIASAQTTSLVVEVDRSKDPARDCSPNTGRTEVPIQIAPGPPSALPDRIAIVSPPRTIVEGTCSEAIWIELHDAAGNPLAAADALTVDLATDPSTVAKPAGDSRCLVGTATVVIAAGDSRAVLFVAGVVPGSADLVVSAPNVGGDRQTQTVIASVPSELRFITSPRSVASGDCSEPLVIALLDAAGNPSPALGTFPIAFIPSGAPADFATYSDPDCTTAAPQIDMPAGASQVTIYFSGVTPAVVPLTASALLVSPDTQDATVLDPGCGNGRLDGAEQCDDANALDGDGCSGSCSVEQNFVCVREPSICLPVSETAVVDSDTCPATGTGSNANPYCQINVGLGSANVVIRQGVYGESLVISGQTRRLIAEPGTFLLGGNNALTIQMGSEVEVVGLAIQSATGNGILVTDTSVLILIDATIGPTQLSGVESNDTSSIRIYRTRFSNCRDAIRVASTGPFDITSTIIADSEDDGLVFTSLAPNGRLHGLTVVNTTNVGIVCDASGVLLVSSIVWGSGMRDIGSGCGVTSSDYLTGGGAMTGNVSVDPAFVPDGSYHLLTTSPLIDMGSEVDAPPDDFDGQPRIQGAMVDIGADEVR